MVLTDNLITIYDSSSTSATTGIRVKLGDLIGSMSYGVEIFNQSGQTRLDSSTSTLVLVASGSDGLYAGTTVVNVTVPELNGGSGTSYAIRTGGSENGFAGEVVKLSMSTQTNLRIEWFAGANTSDFIAYAVYHR